MRKLCLCISLLALFITSNGYCWNALGHRLVAQIAYNHLTKNAKKIYNKYNQALGKIYRPQSLVNSAVWLDSLHEQRELHYINLPFSLDGTSLIPPNKKNAVFAIEAAKIAMQSSLATDFKKGLSLRILLHVVGDIHQPMHAVSQFSTVYPKGDKGGNLVSLKANPVAANLHVYWDKGGGLLTTTRPYSNSLLKRKAYNIEKHWPCPAKMNLDPKKWAEESHQIAVNKAYQLKIGQKPSKEYQHMVKLVTEQRIALAGCRLAKMLNNLS